MDSPINILTIKNSDLDISLDEALRYLGYKKALITPEDRALVSGYIQKIRPSIDPRACYRRFPLEVKGDGNIVLPYGQIYSEYLTKNLLGCSEIIFFAATLGAGFDRALKKAIVSSITEAACFQAIGAAFVEALCESLVKKVDSQIKGEGLIQHPRYSPGFADYGLEHQKGIFSCLTPEKYIGVTLMDSLIMAPEKSVTALIGLEKA